MLMFRNRHGKKTIQLKNILKSFLCMITVYSPHLTCNSIPSWERIQSLSLNFISYNILFCILDCNNLTNLDKFSYTCYDIYAELYESVISWQVKWIVVALSWFTAFYLNMSLFIPCCHIFFNLFLIHPSNH